MAHVKSMRVATRFFLHVSISRASFLVCSWERHTLSCQNKMWLITEREMFSSLRLLIHFACELVQVFGTIEMKNYSFFWSSSLDHVSSSLRFRIFFFTTQRNEHRSILFKFYALFNQNCSRSFDPLIISTWNFTREWMKLEHKGRVRDGTNLWWISFRETTTHGECVGLEQFRQV